MPGIAVSLYGSHSRAQASRCLSLHGPCSLHLAMAHQRAKYRLLPVRRNWHMCRRLRCQGCPHRYRRFLPRHLCAGNCILT
ncbi:hypothetical protein C8K18_11886 [Paraburkholderia sp. GV068]|nr:hypothetical protein C8K19_11886 [Paraburkholderia sp. GV072]PUA99791.1 hypothetical protein C8K18_11886 [Paraburkholderia sp. GV068]